MTRKKTTPKTKPRKTTARKPRKRAAKRKTPRFSLSSSQKALIVGIFIIFSTAILVLSLFAPAQGQLTSWLSSLMWQVFGYGAYFVPVATAGIGLYLVLLGMDQPPQLPIYRLLGIALLFFVFLAFASMISLMLDETLTGYWQVAQTGAGGGYLGSAIASVLTALVGDLGAVFILMVLGLLGAVLVSGITRDDMSGYLKAVFSREAVEDDELDMPRQPIRINPDRESTSQSQQLTLLPDEQKQQKEKPPKPKRRAVRTKKPQSQPASSSKSQAAISTKGSGGQAGYTWTLPLIVDILESGTDLDLNNVAIREQVEIIEHTLESFGAPATIVEINQGPTVTQFGVEPNYIQMRNGRRTKVKVSKIAGLADDLSLALAARSIRIQAPVPGKSYVGIEVPNPSKSLVSLRDVMESPEYRKIKTSLALGLGQNVSGQSIVADLASMPHMLIAGTTGSGKSVLVNAIISSLLLQNTPTDLKLVMIDPKRVELTGYNGIPHLAAPVVVEMDRVISTLQWALREMDARYKKFAEIGVRHIGEYNKKIMRRKDAEKMPYIVIIIDELADLMMLAPEDTERSVTRLAQLARATGIHMVIATQRPSVDVVTGLIKANFPARIAFAVASSTDSRVILDSTGAERLLGQGDMLFQKPDSPAPLRLQGCYVSDSEIDKLVTYWQRARRSATITPDSAAPSPAPPPPPESAAPAPTIVSAARPASPPPPEPVAPLEQDAPAAKPKPKPKPKTRQRSSSKKNEEPLQQQPLWEVLQEEIEKPEYSDELMPEAIALVRKLNKASTSLLQRRFRIGYTRAARMIDAMEEMGIIGPPTGTSKARDVFPPPEGDDESSATAAPDVVPEEAGQPSAGSE